MNAHERNQEALTRAVSGQTWSNYPAIFDGFIRKGKPEADIRPRENVFTYNAWRALGRQVRKGEHGVKIVTYIDCESKGRKTEQTENVDDQEQQQARKNRHCSRPWTTTVFHVSQTDPMKGGAA